MAALAGIPGTAGGVANVAVLFRRRQRFHNEMTPQQFAKFAGNLVNESFDHWRTRTYDCYQRCCLNIQ